MQDTPSRVLTNPWDLFLVRITLYRLFQDNRFKVMYGPDQHLIPLNPQLTEHDKQKLYRIWRKEFFLPRHEDLQNIARPQEFKYAENFLTICTEGDRDGPTKLLVLFAKSSGVKKEEVISYEAYIRSQGYDRCLVAAELCTSHAKNFMQRLGEDTEREQLEILETLETLEPSETAELTDLEPLEAGELLSDHELTELEFGGEPDDDRDHSVFSSSARSPMSTFDHHDLDPMTPFSSYRNQPSRLPNKPRHSAHYSDARSPGPSVTSQSSRCHEPFKQDPTKNVQLFQTNTASMVIDMRFVPFEKLKSYWPDNKFVPRYQVLSKEDQKDRNISNVEQLQKILLEDSGCTQTLAQVGDVLEATKKSITGGRNPNSEACHVEIVSHEECQLV